MRHMGLSNALSCGHLASFPPFPFPAAPPAPPLAPGDMQIRRKANNKAPNLANGGHCCLAGSIPIHPSLPTLPPPHQLMIKDRLSIICALISGGMIELDGIGADQDFISFRAGSTGIRRGTGLNGMDPCVDLRVAGWIAPPSNWIQWDRVGSSWIVFPIVVGGLDLGGGGGGGARPRFLSLGFDCG